MTGVDETCACRRIRSERDVTRQKNTNRSRSWKRDEGHHLARKKSWFYAAVRTRAGKRAGRGRRTEGRTSNQNEKCKRGADAVMFRWRFILSLSIFSSKFSVIFWRRGCSCGGCASNSRSDSWLRSGSKLIGFKFDSFSNPICRADCPHCLKQVAMWDLALFRGGHMFDQSGRLLSRPRQARRVGA